LIVNGKRIQKSARTSDVKIAEQRLDELRAGLLSGYVTLEKEEDVEKHTFGYYSEIYIKTKHLKPSTKQTYRLGLKRVGEFLDDRDITSIKPSEIKMILHEFNLMSSTYKQYLKLIRGVFNEAILDLAISYNPCEKIKAPKDDSEEIFPFTQDELNRIIEHSDGWFQNFIATAFYTGCRVGELFALKWQNVDFKNKRIYIDSTRGDYKEGTTKTGKSRYVLLFDNLVKYLTAQRKKTGMREYVFLTDSGRNLIPANVRNYFWKPILKQLNIPFRKMGATRHTFATIMLQDGSFTINQVAKMMGHANIQMIIKHYNRYLKDEISGIDTAIDPFKNSEKCVNSCVMVG
jgi:integrase